MVTVFSMRSAARLVDEARTPASAVKTSVNPSGASPTVGLSPRPIKYVAASSSSDKHASLGRRGGLSFPQPGPRPCSSFPASPLRDSSNSNRPTSSVVSDVLSALMDTRPALGTVNDQRSPSSASPMAPSTTTIWPGAVAITPAVSKVFPASFVSLSSTGGGQSPQSLGQLPQLSKL